MELRFHEYRLDPADERLWRGSEVVHLTPKTFQLLRFLAGRAGALVTKEELGAALWPDTAVSEDALTRCIGELRRALRDPPRTPRFVATVHRRGFRFVAPVATDEVAEPAAWRAPAFVGRARELTSALERLSESLDGHGRVVLICGEPGIGKTRLAERLASEARARGARVLSGRGFEGERGPPFWIWIQVLRELAGEVRASELHELGGIELAELAELVPELRAHAAGSPARGKLAPEEGRFRIFDAVTRLVVRAAERSPLVLLLDDLHGADPDSLLLTSFLAREIGRAPILLIGTYRDVGTPRNPALAATLRELTRERCESIELRGLDSRSVQQLLGELSSAEVAPNVAELAHEKTGGNPLYLYELVRLLRGLGTLDAPASWRVETPETVRQVLARRLAGLSAGCRDALALAAVAGVEFSQRLLQRSTRDGDDQIAAGIGEAEAQRLVASASDGRDRFRFAHGLVREILYDGLGAGVRSRLHRRIAVALEAETRSSADPPLAELAHHFGGAVLGGDLGKAIHYARLAGEHALALFAFEEAAAHFESALEALEALDPLDPAPFAPAALACAFAHWAAGRPDRARQLARQAIEHARRSGSAELIAQATSTWCGFQPAYGRDPEVVPLLDEALARLGDEPLAARARLLGLRSYHFFLEAEPQEQERCAQQATDLARASGDPHALLHALSCRCDALLHPRQEHEWRAAYQEMIDLAQRTGDASAAFEARLHRLEHHMQLAEPEAIERDLAELEALVDALRTPYRRATLLRARAGLAVARGALAEAWQLAEQALAAGRSVDAAMAQMISVLQMGAILHMQQRIAQVEPEVQVGAAANPRIALAQVGPIFILAESGAVDEARRLLRTLVDTDFATLPHDVSYALCLSNLALSFARLQQSAGADRLYELLLPYAGRNLTLFCHYSGGCASRHLGILATQLQHWPEAIAHFETALSVDRRMGSRAWESFGLLDYARMRRARGTREDRERAILLAREAHDLAVALGNRLVEREAAALLH